MAYPAWLFLSALAPVQSAPPSPPADQTIIVTGTRPTQNALTDYVESITTDVNGQIATFREPICPAAFGLPHTYNRVIEQRIREDAARVGIRVAGNLCDANVVLIVADDPGPLVAALRRERPQMFIGLENWQVEDVLRTKDPVRTWQAVEPRGSDGRPLQRVMFFGIRPIAGQGAWINPAASNSRIEQNIRPDLVASFILMSADETDGLTLRQIADYAAMRTLAQTTAPVESSGRTILSLFNHRPERMAPDGLTPWDLAYLRSLYATDNRVPAHLQESAIADAMRRELNGSER